MRTNYRPGGWNALVTESAMVVLPATADADLIAGVWEGLVNAHDLGSIVDLLAAKAGSVAGLPQFAAVVTSAADVRIALRGPVRARVITESGAEEFTGEDVSTWSERLVRSASRFELALEESEEPELPVLGGVVRVGHITVELVDPPESAAVGSSARSAGNRSAEPPAGESAPAQESALPSALPSLSRLMPAAGGAVPVVLPPAAAQSPDSAADAIAAPETAPETAAETVSAPAPVADGAPVPDEVRASAIDTTLLPEDVNSAPEVDEFDLLWGETVHRPATVATETALPNASSGSEGEGDHDGATISVAEARALRKDISRTPVASSEAPTAVLPVVSQGRLLVSTGQVITLDRTVIIGRKPRSTRASGADLPHLVAVESPQQDISRNHLEVRPEGDTVVVIDLHATNGSTLLRPGADPVRLHPGEQTLVLSGDTVDLGDGITVTFEGLP